MEVGEVIHKVSSNSKGLKALEKSGEFEMLEEADDVLKQAV